MIWHGIELRKMKLILMWVWTICLTFGYFTCVWECWMWVIKRDLCAHFRNGNMRCICTHFVYHISYVQWWICHGMKNAMVDRFYVLSFCVEIDWQLGLWIFNVTRALVQGPCHPWTTAWSNGWLDSTDQDVRVVSCDNVWSHSGWHYWRSVAGCSHDVLCKDTLF